MLKALGITKSKPEAATEEQIKAHRQLSATRDQVQKQITEQEKIISDLRDAYILYKSYFPIFRYQELKTMIKEANLRFQQMQEQCKQPAPKKRDGVITRLRKHAEGFASDVEEATHYAEMSYDTIESELDTLNVEVERLRNQSNNLSDRLQKLAQNYMESKAHNPVNRYALLKDMIKETVRNKASSNT